MATARAQAFVGTFTSTPVSAVLPGDRVQWRAEVATVLAVEPVLGATRLRLAFPSRIRPTEVSLSNDYVLMTQRPEGR
jgi:hypothetical protein